MKQHQIEASTLPLASLSKGQGHKFDHGHVVVVSGGSGRTGAARLAARGALRIGAGLVTLLPPLEAVGEVASQITAIMLQPVGSQADLVNILKDDRINSICIGPGLGMGALQSDFVLTCLESKRPVVLDADALTLLSQSKVLFDALHAGCIMTPHAGEFARLFPNLSKELVSDELQGKVGVVQAAVSQASCPLVLKGSETVVASPSGDLGIHSATKDRSAPWLATAGSGDVLAGFIAGLLARGFAPHIAAEVAVFLHVECARSFGPGLISEDLPEQLPVVLRRFLQEI